MTKKKYCPMTIEHEALEMNQAVAACATYDIRFLGKGTCEDCAYSPASATPHYWNIYEDSISGKQFGVAVNDAPSVNGNGSSCYSPGLGGVPIQKNTAIWAAPQTELWQEWSNMVNVMRDAETADLYDGELSGYISGGGVMPTSNSRMMIITS